MSAPASSRAGRPANPGLRSNILDAALELFSERGYDATAISQVVERAGVTKGALYHYFQKKEDLLYEIYRTLLDEQLADLDEIIAKQNDPVQTLREIIEDLVITTIKHLKAVIVSSRYDAQFSEQRWRTLQADWRHYQDVVRTLIRTGQEDGVFTRTVSPELASWMIFGLNPTLPNWYRVDGPKTPQELAREASTFILAALQTGAPREAGAR
ncbi:MAG: TetR/AcrR family transcriptional regulator [Actinomycetota bacterium]|nr:TetR/AcrR family transcriptional regulator [Actinomycetota bacterium]